MTKLALGILPVLEPGVIQGWCDEANLSEPLHFVREEVSVKIAGGRNDAHMRHYLLAHKVQRDTAFATLQQIEWASGSSTECMQSVAKHVDKTKFCCTSDAEHEHTKCCLLHLVGVSCSRHYQPHNVD